YLLDLECEPDDLIARFDRNRRRQLRRYEEARRDFVVERARLLAFLLETYPAFIRRVRAADSAVLSAATLTALVNAPTVEIVGAAPNGRIEAVFLFGHTPYAGDCLLNVATPVGREYTTHLLWYGILALKAKCVPLLNL